MSLFAKVKWFVQLVVQVDVIIALGGFGTILLDPIKNEYVFKEVLGPNVSRTNASECRRANFSAPKGTLFEHEVSSWVLLLDMAIFVPASIGGVLLMSWSDRIGRKIAMVISLITTTLSSALFVFSVHFAWPLKSLFAVNVVAGLGGYYMALLMQGFAYISDVTSLEKRGMRFVILETSLGVAGGLAGVLSGFWVKNGFILPIIVSTITSGVALLLVGVLPDSKKIKEKIRKESKLPECDCDVAQHLDSNDDSSESSSTASLISKHHRGKDKYTVLDLLRSVWRVYTSDYSHCVMCSGPRDANQNVDLKADRCEHGGGRYPGRPWRMWAYLVSYNFFMFCSIGTMVFQTIYFLSPPLCFTPVLVGIQLGLKFAGVAISPFLVLIYQRCFKLSNYVIIIINFFAMMTSYIIIALANTHAVVFIGTGAMVFGFASKPFIQTQISGMVAEWEQGSAFALLSFTETLTFLAATAVFLTLYPATLPVYHGFCWFFAAGIVLIPITLVTVVWLCDRRRENAHKRALLVDS